MMNQLKKTLFDSGSEIIARNIKKKSNDSELNKATVRLTENGLIDLKNEIIDV